MRSRASRANSMDDKKKRTLDLNERFSIDFSFLRAPTTTQKLLTKWKPSPEHCLIMFVCRRSRRCMLERLRANGNRTLYLCVFVARHCIQIDYSVDSSSIQVSDKSEREADWIQTAEPKRYLRKESCALLMWQIVDCQSFVLIGLLEEENEGEK